MTMDEATLRQIEAAEPDASTWLSANAGSGKTKVLTDRVARLLLNGTPPQRILCLTYTKAAASEMQNRLFKRLGEWAMLPSDELTKELSKLGENVSAHDDLLARARRLFARAIETPGGLKIQTIHAFCSALLRRFPLEAAVAPDFTEVEERSLEQLRMELLDRFAQGPEAAALDDILDYLDEESFRGLLANLGKHRDAFRGDLPDLHALFGLPAGFDETALLASVFHGDEAALFARIVPLLMAGGPTDVKLAHALQASQALGVSDLAVLESKLLFGSNAAKPFGAKIDKLGTKAVKELIAPADLDALHALAERVETARQQRHALASVKAATALHRFARLWLPAFEDAKMRLGWLDFDDLITRAGQLLGSSSVAQWVLFKLDGGIDHILVDEAQDTSPAQWHVIDLLTQEFTAGEGARDLSRTIFVVGDRKQSIYSFQGADLRGFERSFETFRTRLEAVNKSLNPLELKHSFRSSDAILRFVDHCFSVDSGAEGLGGTPEHIAFHEQLAGRVDLWPAIPKPEKPEELPWDSPLDRQSESHPDIKLAKAIAGEIRALIDRGEQIEGKDGPRPVHEGDFLILVRRRALLFDALIRSCKAEGLEIAGADRLVLSEELAVQDLIALLKFLTLPEDDLSLAIALRSPLFGWSEDQLFRLAYGRGDAFLWEKLRADPAHAQTREILDDLRAQVDFLRPFELIERILTRHDGRRRIRARFGAEVDEALEAFVDLALSYEPGHIPSLDGFLGWLAASDAEVKRQSEAAGRRIRVMTVHGSKGLEAPIVILPDTAPRQNTERGKLAEAGGTAILRANAAEKTAVQAGADDAATALRDEESERLLYVAMTRAERWLIVAGAGDMDKGSDDKPQSWYGRIAAAMAREGSLDLETPTGTGRRFEHGVWPAPAKTAREMSEHAAVQVSLPELPHAISDAAPLSPSMLGGAKALPGEGADPETAMRRGSMVHKLLEHLPALPENDWQSAAAEMLTTFDTDADERSECVQEAIAVLKEPELRGLFDDAALVEVSLTGNWRGRPLWGVIDRLIITPDRVLAVDFKTNTVVPDTGAQVPEGVLRQMGAYAHLLAEIYPNHRIEIAILWTRTRDLMLLDAATISSAFERATLDPSLAPS